MKIYYSDDKIESTLPAVALGNFDGMHIGHTAIFENAKKCGESFGALLFETHTSAMTGTGVEVITTLDEKLEILSGLGADFAYIVSFDRAFMNMDCSEFAAFLAKTGAKTVSVGYDYRCGRGAAYDVTDLEDGLSVYGIKMVVAPPVRYNGEPVKSSRIREHLKNGDITGANLLMSKPYSISGIVVDGLKNGRRMGFPTANIECDTSKLLPKDGVYCGGCTVDGTDFPAVINIGKNPTFSAKNRTVEVHIISYDGDLYGRRLAVQLTERIRGDMRFESIDALSEQISRDREYAVERSKIR